MAGKSFRIGVDARSLLDTQPRGEGRSLLRLYQEIARIRPTWAFLLYGQTGGGAAARAIDNARACIFDLPGFRFNLWENLGLPWRAARDRVDLLHASSSGSPKWSRVPVVMTVHDLIPLLFEDGQNEAGARRFRTQLVHGLRLARTVITVSEHTKRDLLRLFPIDPERVVVIPWGVDPEPAAEPHAPLTTRRPYLMTFGGAARRKNTLGTVQAFLRFARHDPGHDLIVAGMAQGGARSEIEAVVRASGLSERVELLGYVPEAEIDRLLSGATCLLYLSRYEGFGLPVLEAMTRGVPILAADRTSIPEVAGKAALLVDPDDPAAIDAALAALVADSALRMRLSAEGRARAAAFDWSRTAQSTIAVFERASARGA